jgi:tetratricopeptide (TPR) repeat protein
MEGSLAERLLPAVLGEIQRRDLAGRLLVEKDGETVLDLAVGGGRGAGAGGVEDAVRRAAGLPEGRFRLLPGAPPERGMPLPRLALVAARAVPGFDRVRAAIGSLDAPLALTPLGQAGATDLGLLTEEGFLLSRIDGRAGAREICLISPVGEEQTLRAIYGLTAAGLVQIAPRAAGPPKARPDPLSRLEGFLRRTGATDGSAAPAAGGGSSTGPSPATPPPPAAPVAASAGAGSEPRAATAPPVAAAAPVALPAGAGSDAGPPPATPAPAAAAPRAAPRPPVMRESVRARDAERLRLEQRLQQAERQNHYEILGLPMDASTDEIRRTYFILARQFHPDRFHRPSVRDLQPALEKLFARMTEAYQTLTAEDRHDYDSRLRRGGADSRAVQQKAAREVARDNYRHGRGLLEKGQLVKAIQYLESAVKADDTQPEYLEALGALQSLNPRSKADAEAHLKRAIERGPTRATGYLALGLHCARYGRLPEAQRLWKQALSWDPGCEPARRMQAAVAGGDKAAAEEATRLLRRLLEDAGRA